MRRHNRRSLRGFRKKGRVAWVTDMFAVTPSLAAAPATPERLSLLERDDFYSSAQIVSARMHVKRVIVKGTATVQPLNDGAWIPFRLHMGYALMIVDQDDTDSLDISSAAVSTALQSSRVLHVGMQSWELRPFNGTNTSGESMVFHGQNIDIDWRGSAVLEPDQLVLLVLQKLQPTTTAEDSAIWDVSCYSRTLVRLP